MILYWLFFISFTIYACRNWKYAVISWASISLLFNPVVCLRFEPPNLQLGFAINLILFLLYLLRDKRCGNMYIGAFLFNKAFIAYVFSYILSSAMALDHIGGVITMTVQYFTNTFVILYLFHKAMVEEADLRLFFKVNICVIILFSCLGLYEFLFKDNPWLNYVYFSCDNEDLIAIKSSFIPASVASSGELRSRFGMVRAYSVFQHPIEYGCVCVMLLFLYLHIFHNRCTIVKQNQVIYIILLLIVGVIICNSKSPIVGILFFLPAAISFNDIFRGQSMVMLLFLGVVGSVALMFNDNIFNTVIALFDKDKMAEGGESTPELRMQQFTAAFLLWLQNPIIGNGPGSIDLLIKNMSLQEIGGAESIWMKILPERGIIGLIPLYLLYQAIYKALKKNVGIRTAVFFSLGLLALETVTGPMNMLVYGVIVILLSRYNLKQMQTNKM